MTQLTKTRSGNGHGKTFPTVDNFFRNRLFGPSLLDIESDLLEGRITAPLANITETKKEFKVDLSAPGLKKDDFRVELEDGALVVSAEKKEETKEDTENYRRREFSYNSFSRSFQLPENVEEEKINARYENGMLHISIPKKEVSSSTPKKSIKVG
jgi:HSP20 family protein